MHAVAAMPARLRADLSNLHVVVDCANGAAAELAPAAYARAGAQLISIGALTHSVSAASISFAIQGPEIRLQ